MTTSGWDLTKIRYRKPLLAAGGLLILIAVVVLAQEVAVYFISARTAISSLNILQIVSAIVAFLAVTSGISSIIAARGAADTATAAKRSFLISAILSAIAAIALMVAISLILPAVMGWWSHPHLSRNILPTTPTPQNLNATIYQQQQTPAPLAVDETLAREEEEISHERQTLAILKVTGLFGGGVLLLGTVVCAVLSLINYRLIWPDATENIRYHRAPRASTAYQDPRVDKMITDL